MGSDASQLYLPTFKPNVQNLESQEQRSNGQINQLDPQDRAFHDWYRFVLSFPPHLVRDYVEDFGIDTRHIVLDPFCGTGTTLVESKLLGIRSVGLEMIPFSHFASSVKVDWSVDPDILAERAHEIADHALETLQAQGIDDNWPCNGDIKSLPLRKLDPNAAKLVIKDSISPLPLHKTLILLDFLKAHSQESYYHHALLALGNALVSSIGNLRFGPEVGIGKRKKDTPVVAAWLAEIAKMVKDLHTVSGQPHPRSNVHLADARQIDQIVRPGSVDAVITSPPYPNEKDYSRTTRLESVILGFISDRSELRAAKKGLVRSNTRSVYKDDDDDEWIADHAEIQRIAETIESRRIELGKTSGFERQYGRVTRLYFGGMARHFASLRTVLTPGARLAYVVGDQASYLRIMIRTGQLLADIAQSLGYELVRTDLFRTRFATATQEELREEVVVLRWPG